MDFSPLGQFVLGAAFGQDDGRHSSPYQTAREGIGMGSSKKRLNPVFAIAAKFLGGVNGPARSISTAGPSLLVLCRLWYLFRRASEKRLL